MNTIHSAFVLGMLTGYALGVAVMVVALLL